MSNLMAASALNQAQRKIKDDYRKYVGRKIFFIVCSLILLLLVSGISAILGSYDIPIWEVYVTIWRGLFQTLQATHEIVIWELRLPRILLGIIAGAGFATAGAALQGILKNPLACPWTVGISAGATFGAAVGILLGAGLVGGKYLIIGNAFVFSLIPTFIILALTRYRRATPETIVLAGIATTYMFQAFTTLLMYFSESDAVREAYFWTVGSLGRASWENLMLPFIIVTVGFILLVWKSRDVNVMNAGDESAKSVGVDVEKTRVFILVVASLMSAGVVSFTGAIGFIGLVAPHICRMVIGSDHKYLIPASAVFGGVLLLSADTIARTIMAPIVLPVGIVTAFMGGPLFFYLIIKRRRDYWQA
ncbi:MAG: iron ABC transporter permease [Firmicutes bacterium]|nr:iron ABC transporter permease [Bacillota bacterium]